MASIWMRARAELRGRWASAAIIVLLIGLAGGENIFADTSIPYPQVGMEEIIRRNPDVIIDIGPNMGENEMLSEAQKESVRQVWSKYAFLGAVKNGKVFPASADYFVTPGPRVVQAVRDIRKMLAMQKR